LQEAFTLSWIRSHTFLPIDGVSVKKNTKEAPLWRKYFKGKFWEKYRDESDKGKKNKVLRGGKISSENKQRLVIKNLSNISEMCPLFYFSVFLATFNC